MAVPATDSHRVSPRRKIAYDQGANGAGKQTVKQRQARPRDAHEPPRRRDRQFEVARRPLKCAEVANRIAGGQAVAVH